MADLSSWNDEEMSGERKEASVNKAEYYGHTDQRPSKQSCTFLPKTAPPSLSCHRAESPKDRKEKQAQPVVAKEEGEG